MSDTFDHEGDAWDMYEEDESEYGYVPTKATCKFCGQKNLYWHCLPQTGWRLFTLKDVIHVCNELAPIDFQ